MKREWIKFLGMTPEFPRDVGFMQPDARRDFVRRSVNNAQEYVNTVQKYIDSRGCFVNVYSKRQQQLSEIDKLFFDVDAETLEEAYVKRKLAHQFFDRLEWDFRETFTANKGFQYMVDFPFPVTVDWEELKEFCKRLNSNAGGIFDESVFGDKNRVCRLPLTPNMKSLRHGHGVLWCVPVERDWDLDKIIQVAKLDQECTAVEIAASHTAMRDVDSLPKTGVRKFEYKESPRVWTTSQLTETQKEYYEGLVGTIMTLVAPNAEDGRKAVLHFLLIPALIQLGHTDQQIHESSKHFIERSKKSYNRSGYQNYVEQSIIRNRSGFWKPVSVGKFMVDHPDVFC